MPAFSSLARCPRPALIAIMALAPLVACERGATGSDSRDTSVARDTVQHAAVARDTATRRMPITSDTSDPTATVTAYLTALRAHAAARDTMLWESAAGSDDGFRTFGDTAITGFRIGAPGRIEGAAGSRYVDVPMTVDLATRTAPIRLRATATLRRAVVDGATEAQRRWRIMRIQWGVPTAPSLDSTPSR